METEPLKKLGKIYLRELLEQPQIGFQFDSKLVMAINYIDKDGNWILGEQVTVTKEDLDEPTINTK